MFGLLMVTIVLVTLMAIERRNMKDCVQYVVVDKILRDDVRIFVLDNGENVFEKKVNVEQYYESDKGDYVEVCRLVGEYTKLFYKLTLK